MRGVGLGAHRCWGRADTGDLAEESGIEDLDIEADGSMTLPDGWRLFVFENTLFDETTGRYP